jgi:ADP-heptose:LPS heptosyltransferase
VRQLSLPDPLPTLAPVLGNIATDRVAIFRALQLGDLLCAVPALRALRAALPRSDIILAGLPWAEDFVRRYSHYLDGFLSFPGAPGLPERSAKQVETNRFFEHAHEANFDLVLQMHGNGRYTNSIVTGMGARHYAGFYRPGDPCPDPDRFLVYPEADHEIERLLRLTDALGIPRQGTDIDFPIFEREWHIATELQIHYGLRQGEYVCVHPGARAPARRWNPEKFARIADRLVERGLRVVLTGSLEEIELASLVQHLMKRDCANLAGRTTIGEIGALLAGARLLICNDTGVSHIAAALNVASVVVYMGSSPARWAPLDQTRHRRAYRSVDCRPCEHWHCPIEHPCARGVLVEDVMRQVEAML